jgi:hypothetical protein
VIRTASREFAADGSRAAFPSEPYSILYLISGLPLTTATDPPGLASAPRILPSAPRRPGEKYERLEASLAARRQLAIAGGDLDLPVDVAGTLLLEATLLLDRLGAHRLTRARELLDQAARSSRVTRALSTANADYLRALGCRSWRRQVGELDVPVRVASRVGDTADERLARVELLEPALRWEMAALLCDRTMANWGSDVVLGGFR